MATLLLFNNKKLPNNTAHTLKIVPATTTPEMTPHVRRCSRDKRRHAEKDMFVLWFVFLLLNDGPNKYEKPLSLRSALCDLKCLRQNVCFCFLLFAAVLVRGRVSVYS